LIPEIPFDIGAVCNKIMDREARGRRFSIVVVAEGARPAGGDLVAKDQGAGREELLGGISRQVAEEIQNRTGKETRTVVLGHLQRGGGPTTFDRLLSLRFGAAAVRMVADHTFGVMVALDPPTVLAVPLEVATERMKCVPLDSDTMLTARDLGISFGDEVEDE
jgi:6-phosphofructokinase 1